MPCTESTKRMSFQWKKNCAYQKCKVIIKKRKSNNLEQMIRLFSKNKQKKTNVKVSSNLLTIKAVIKLFSALMQKEKKIISELDEIIK